MSWQRNLASEWTSPPDAHLRASGGLQMISMEDYTMEIKYGDRRDYLHYCSLSLYWLLMLPMIPIGLICGLGCWFFDWYKDVLYRLTKI